MESCRSLRDEEKVCYHKHIHTHKKTEVKTAIMCSDGDEPTHLESNRESGLICTSA